MVLIEDRIDIELKNHEQFEWQFSTGGCFLVLGFGITIWQRWAYAYWKRFHIRALFVLFSVT